MTSNIECFSIFSTSDSVDFEDFIDADDGDCKFFEEILGYSLVGLKI
jgi:hypothetical protein